MKELTFNEFAGYASAFVSSVLPKLYGIREIVLFGSVVRNDAGRESDVDMFFDIEDKKNEEKIKSILDGEIKKFYKSKIAEIWSLKGINNAINVKVGKLEEWKLKRSIISEGIILYGKYKEIPEKIKGFAYFNIRPVKDISKRNRIIRTLFGRKEKTYFSKGIIENFAGKKLSPDSFAVPKEHSMEIIKILEEEKIDFIFFEFWTDQI